jgi:glycosyltransferase involved in cell wall biosynthesis
MTFAIVANGFADGPAQALRDYLVAKGSEVWTVFHPLSAEQGRTHVVTSYAQGERLRERHVRLPLRPPASFALDPFVPPLPPRVDVWFGFNPLACARGLVASTGRTVLWSVDFVPDRFGRDTLPTRIYDRLDRLCCLRADARVELSDAAREARNSRHGLGDASAHVVPMGAWLDRVPSTSEESFRRGRVVFLGHLVERQGVATLLAALDGRPADIVGTGPLAAELRAQAHENVRFHGYVADHREVERLLSEAAVAVAPYRQTAETFTRYADPGKLKAYLAAGLPIVLTDVPPNASELAVEAGAELVADDPRALRDAIERALASAEGWRARRAAALAYARRFDWNVLLPDLLAKLDVSPAPNPSKYAA